MGNFNGWQTNNNVFAVQNENYLLKGFYEFEKLYKNSLYLRPALIHDAGSEQQVWFGRVTSQTINKVSAVNKDMIRISGYAGLDFRIIRGKMLSENISYNPYADRNDARFQEMFGLGGWSYDTRNFATITDKKRFCPVITPIKKYISKNQSLYPYISEQELKIEYCQADGTGGGGYSTPLSVNDLDENLFVFEEFYPFRYRSDGNYWENLKSYSDMNKYDVYTPYHRVMQTCYNGIYQGIIFCPYLGSYTPYSSVYSTNSSGDYYYKMGYATRYILDNFHLYMISDKHISPARYMVEVNLPMGDTQKDYSDILPDRHKMFFATTKENWIKIFNASGWEWSFDEKVVADPDGDLNKPIYPGQPTNPTGGGGGTGDNISDEIPLPTPSFLPNNTAYNRYWLKGSDINNLQTFLFSDTFLNDVKRLWTDPAEYMIKLAYYPFDGVAHDYNGTTNATVSIGGIASQISGFAMLDNYNNKFLGGTLDITEYYGTYLDYSPYTTAEIYIPYIGYRQINLSDVMGKTLEIQYAVDFDTGIITAFVLSDSTPLTMYSAPFGVEVALSGTNANQVAQSVLGMVGNVVSAAGGVVSLITSAGASAPVAVPKITGAAGNLVNQVMNLDISPRNFGSPSPTTALYAPQQPFIVLHRPITAEPADFAALNGYAAGYSGLVSGFSGYLKASSVKLSYDTKVSQAEQQEIISLLMGGIYIG